MNSSRKRLTKKQEVVIGVAVGLIIIAMGFAAGLWFSIAIGVACLIYTSYRALKTK